MEKEHKVKILERFDNYYSGINNKGAFILALNTLIISSFLIGLKDLLALTPCYNVHLMKILIFLTIILSIGSMVLTISSIFPFLGSSKKSLWFFIDIANKEKSAFLNEIDSQSESAKTNDINEQIYYLASGLKAKHIRIRWALSLNTVQMILLIIIMVLILF